MLRVITYTLPVTSLIQRCHCRRFVKGLRTIVSPNFNFLGQLLEYEKRLNIAASPSSGAGNKRKRFSEFHTVYLRHMASDAILGFERTMQEKFPVEIIRQ